MKALITKLIIFFFPCLFIPLLARNLFNCEDSSINESSYVCNNNLSENQCSTFAVLHTNSYYSSLFNLSFYLGLNRFTIAEANGFSSEIEFLPQNQPLLIPIECKCSNNGFFLAELSKTTVAGESFYQIAKSLEGLTTCEAIQEKNHGISPFNLQEKIKLLIPLRCACPTISETNLGFELLVSYSVINGDSLTSIAEQFNTTQEAIVSVNNKSSGANLRLDQNPILDSLSILIPLNDKPLLGSLEKPREPKALSGAHKNKLRMRKLEICIIVISVFMGLCLMATVAFFLIQFYWRRKKESCCLSSKMVDVELQQLSLSIRTTSEKKVSFEGSQSTIDGQITEAITPSNKMMVESYTIEELKKATEDFNSQNLIEGSVYHGRLKGKNLAIKSTTMDFISKVDFSLFHDAIHNHPTILRVLGSCLIADGSNSNSYLVFEYAKNGSLKDWIHGGLAMKSQFIASCYCFLTWSQRLRICLDVALGLQYMHHIMHPVYIHRNIKSRNIFLDEEFNAKIGNFGMARCVQDDPQEQEETQFSLRNPSSWNKGYLAPEYLKQGLISPSIDIFAYGVVLLEVLSGKTPIIFSDENNGELVMLYEEIKFILESDNPNELRRWIDKDLGEDYSFDGAVTLANIARACIEQEPSLRPSAGEIVEKLSRMLEESPEEDEQLILINESSSKPLVHANVSNNT